MERRSPSSYEEFIAELITNLAAIRSVTNIGSGAKNRLTGSSGVRHQVDVSFTLADAEPPQLVVVECKSLRTGAAVNLGQVKVLKATIDDLASLGTHPARIVGVLVSSAPLQAGAAKFARHYGLQSHVVSDGPNWVFKWESMLQTGLALQASAATISGQASVVRRSKSAA